MPKVHLTRADAMLPARRVSFLRLLAVGSAVSVFGTMLMGGYTSASGSGLACPDWPLCNGEAIPDLGVAAIAVEFAHRLFAVSASVLILAALLTTLLWFRSDRRLVLIASASFVLLAAQITLGMLTITSDLDPVIVTSHLGIATATFAATLSLAWVSRLAPPPMRRGEPAAG